MTKAARRHKALDKKTSKQIHRLMMKIAKLRDKVSRFYSKHKKAIEGK